MITPWLAPALAVFLALVGLSHFVFPDYFCRLVPPRLPWARALVYVTGAGELVLGIALWVDATRNAAAWAVVGLFAVYVWSHFDALTQAQPDNETWLERPTGAVARVVVNIGYLVWAVAVAMTG